MKYIKLSIDDTLRMLQALRDTAVPAFRWEIFYLLAETAKEQGETSTQKRKEQTSTVIKASS